MVCEHTIENINNKKIMYINCINCANNSSLGNINCFTKIYSKLKNYPEINNILFKRRNYNKILEDESFKLLKEFINLSEINENLELCKECADINAVIKFKLKEDPIGTILYFDEIKPCDKDKEYFNKIKQKLEKSNLWLQVQKYKEEYNKDELYHVIFKSKISPAFVSFFIEELPKNAELLERYSIDDATIEIFKSKESLKPIYHITFNELNTSKDNLKILNKAFLKLSKKEINIENVNAIIKEVIDETAPNLEEKQREKLEKTLKRYSFGYGPIEILFKDPQIQDIFIDSPGDKPLYINHAKYEECETNLIPTREELDKIATRIRMKSGRPFDESYPIINADIIEFGIRACGVCEPITFGGTGFAFRKHNIIPWSLQQFINNKMLSPEAAGLISFLIDSQKSILVTGPRGSGKTSMLGAIMAEIPQKYRIIVIEDTKELPIESLRRIGFNIQQLRIKSILNRESYEASADEALRSALRLGESILIIGEVRGEEARSLFEAMRIGAAGNVVMGTIHGSSAYEVWDRIVHDLGVPSTSFKATDVIVSCAPIRFGEDLTKNRRVVEITEVLKDWINDPQKEKGFLKLMEYDSKKDKLSFSKYLKRSEILKDICKRRGMKIEEALKSIETRAKIKEAIVKEAKRKPELLSINFACKSTSQYIQLAEKYNNKYDKILNDFKMWLKKQ